MDAPKISISEDHDRSGQDYKNSSWQETDRYSVNGKYVAKGEVVVIEESFGVRITEIINSKINTGKTKYVSADI